MIIIIDRDLIVVYCCNKAKIKIVVEHCFWKRKFGRGGTMKLWEASRISFFLYIDLFTHPITTFLSTDVLHWILDVIQYFQIFIYRTCTKRVYLSYTRRRYLGYDWKSQIGWQPTNSKIFTQFWNPQLPTKKILFEGHIRSSSLLRHSLNRNITQGRVCSGTRSTPTIFKCMWTVHYI